MTTSIMAVQDDRPGPFPCENAVSEGRPIVIASRADATRRPIAHREVGFPFVPLHHPIRSQDARELDSNLYRSATAYAEGLRIRGADACWAEPGRRITIHPSSGRTRYVAPRCRRAGSPGGRGSPARRDRE